MNTKFMKSKKYVIVALFVLAALLSVWLSGKVAINYNISDYLDESTETKISLNIIEDEFGKTGDVQVMIENIDTESAKDVVDTIKKIPNVLTVNFDEYDTNYYKDGDALFVVLVDGDEYSDTANAVVEDIRTALDDSFEGKINYGGSVVEKRTMREAIQNEIVLILAIAVCLVIAIMLIMAKSWIEPIILLIASGVAVLINMGTNAIFGEISYITNAVAAILQLALSIDYSIVLLHGYRKAKENDVSSEKAMTSAIFLIVMLVFRSLSLPVILVAVIQGAIWISMSTSLLTGPMFFMSYIITNCILMGATIDYGILMSTNYVQYRQTLDKKEALARSLEIAIPTVFTSGLILTICGFVVGIISSQTSISTVGFLLGKGTLVSVLMITLVLPSVLYLLDGFILKLSMKKKQ